MGHTLIRLLALVVAAFVSASPAHAFLHSGGALGTSGCLAGSNATAVSLGFPCLVFADGPFSASRIDTTNSGASGFNWYGNGPWPNSPNGFGWQQAECSATVTPPHTCTYGTDFSLNGSNYLVVQPAVNPAFGGDTILSCTPAAGNSWHGTAFTGGYYIKMIATWTAAPSGNNTWPLISLDPIEFLNGGTATTFNWIENDMIEIQAGTSVGDQNINYWIVTSGSSGGFSTGGNPSPSLISGTEYDFALIPSPAAAKYYTAGTFTQNGTEPDSHSDWLTIQLSAHNCLGFAGGNGGAIIVQRIEVWCANTTCKQVQ